MLSSFTILHLHGLLALNTVSSPLELITHERDPLSLLKVSDILSQPSSITKRYPNRPKIQPIPYPTPPSSKSLSHMTSSKSQVWEKLNWPERWRPMRAIANIAFYSLRSQSRSHDHPFLLELCKAARQHCKQTQHTEACIVDERCATASLTNRTFPKHTDSKHKHTDGSPQACFSKLINVCTS